MRRIARYRRVLFVNSIGMRMPLPGRSSNAGRRIWRKVKSVMRFVTTPLAGTPDFYVYTPAVLPFYGSRMMRALNAALVRSQIRSIAGRIGIDLRGSVVFLTVPTALGVIRKLPRGVLLYNRSDLHSAFEETDQEYIRQLEQALFEECDHVLYASRTLLESEKGRTNNRAVFLDHGIDLALFTRNENPEPPDLAEVPRPRIGFFGGIDDYVVDLDLLEHLARTIPNASLVIIGDATCSLDRLTALQNVYWLGYRPYESIPAYGTGFDVAIMPWLNNDWIRHSNPIKIKEYLALGLPTVSTDFPEAHRYHDVIEIASSYPEFVARVRRALDGAAISSPERRRQRVSDISWDRQAERLLKIGERSGS